MRIKYLFVFFTPLLLKILTEEEVALEVQRERERERAELKPITDFFKQEKSIFEKKKMLKARFS